MPFGIRGPETDNTAGNNSALAQGYEDALDKELELSPHFTGHRTSALATGTQSAAALLRRRIDPAPPAPWLSRRNAAMARRILRREYAFAQQSGLEQTAVASMSEGTQAPAPLGNRIRNAQTLAAPSRRRRRAFVGAASAIIERHSPGPGPGIMQRPPEPQTGTDGRDLLNPSRTGPIQPKPKPASNNHTSQCAILGRTI